MLSAIILSSIFFLLFLILHIFIFHGGMVKRRFRTLLIVSLFCLLLYSLSYYWLVLSGANKTLNAVLPSAFVDTLNGIFVYFFCFYFYAHLVIVLDRSVSVRMMTDIDRSDRRKLTLEELKSEYSLEDKFRYEVDDMIYLDRLIKTGDFIRNTPKGRTHAVIIKFLRDYLNIGGHQ